MTYDATQEFGSKEEAKVKSSRQKEIIEIKT